MQEYIRPPSLRGEKGINLPDTLMTLPGFTEDDRLALAFVAKHADAVSLSFVRTAEDLRVLQAELDRLKRADIGVILKIETRAGFENLPRLFWKDCAGRRWPSSLRGAIWRWKSAPSASPNFRKKCCGCARRATYLRSGPLRCSIRSQRTGVPSRAEVTDAAESVAAECVMLNKGPYVSEAVSVLVDILGRMAKHRYKKRSLFRKLHVCTFTER